MTTPWDNVQVWEGWYNNRLHYTNGSTFVIPSQQQGLRGDANDDGNVSIADVSVLIDYLLSHDASALNLGNADCNLDENVSIADVSALIDYLLSHSW